MVLVKILGTLDFLVLLMILFSSLFPKDIILYGAFYLIIKGLIFVLTSRDFASYIDVIIGIYTIFIAFNISHPILTIIMVLYMGEKVVVSLI